MTHKNEQLVRDNNVEMMHKQGHTKATRIQCGFLNEKEKWILGASRDGLVTDPSRKDPHGIFEAKYFIVKDGEGLKDALMWNSICKTSDSGVLQVNKNRMYFYLVQQQRLCCEKIQSGKVMKNSFAQRFPLNTNSGRRNKRTLNNFMIWYIIYELAYPRVREGLQWLYVGVVLTDHIQSTFRKSSIKWYIFITTWKFFQTKHRNFLLHCSFTFFNSCNSTWRSLSLSILISSTHFSRVGGWQQQSRSGNLLFFSLYTAILHSL